MSDEYLFVYGTLRRKAVNSRHNLFAGNARFVDAAFVYGTLYEIDGYPGAVLNENTRKKIYGEVYRLTETSRIFRLLDDYEQCSEKHPPPHEYKRIKTGVFLADKRRIEAWLYVYQRSTRKLKPIPHGDYLRYMHKGNSNNDA